MSDPGGNSFVFATVAMFPETELRETSGLEGNKTNWFPEGPDIKSFLIFLDSHFNSVKRICTYVLCGLVRVMWHSCSLVRATWQLDSCLRFVVVIGKK